MTAINRKKPGQGDWGAAANWSSGTALTLGDAATISTSGILTISSADLVNPWTSMRSPAVHLESAGSLTYDGRVLPSLPVASLNGASTMAAPCSNARNRQRRRVACQHSLN